MTGLKRLDARFIKLQPGNKQFLKLSIPQLAQSSLSCHTQFETRPTICIHTPLTDATALSTDTAPDGCVGHGPSNMHWLEAASPWCPLPAKQIFRLGWHRFSSSSSRLVASRLHMVIMRHSISPYSGHLRGSQMPR